MSLPKQIQALTKLSDNFWKNCISDFFKDIPKKQNSSGHTKRTDSLFGTQHSG